MEGKSTGREQPGRSPPLSYHDVLSFFSTFKNWVPAMGLVENQDKVVNIFFKRVALPLSPHVAVLLNPLPYKFTVKSFGDVLLGKHTLENKRHFHLLQ